jgi:hypothetical protein
VRLPALLDYRTEYGDLAQVVFLIRYGRIEPWIWSRAVAPCAGCTRSAGTLPPVPKRVLTSAERNQ